MFESRYTRRVADRGTFEHPQTFCSLFTEYCQKYEGKVELILPTDKENTVLVIDSKSILDVMMMFAGKGSIEILVQGTDDKAVNVADVLKKSLEDGNFPYSR